MSHLKSATNSSPHERRLSASTDTQGPVPTSEFLARQILALPLCEQTSIGGALAEIADFLRPNTPDTFIRVSHLIPAIKSRGIHISIAPDDDEPPIHVMVVQPAQLVKRYPELKRILDELDGLQLMPPAV